MDRVVEGSREVIKQGSKSFAAASKLFDPEIRDSASMLYAWCRYCDDQTDDQELGFNQAQLPPDEARRRIDRLRSLTESALAGEHTDDPIFVGLQRVVSRHQIPHRYPLEHLDGFVMDVDGTRYRTLDDTLTYCYHVAGVVGVMMTYIMGVDDEPTLDRATDLGIAFQLTNICRDVVEDADAQRVYLPEAWVEEAEIPLDDVAAPRNRQALFDVVVRVLMEADRYYESCRYGLSQLPFRSAWAVSAAHAVYRDIGRLILERGPAAWDRRASTSTARKLQLALGGGMRAIAATGWGPGPEDDPRLGLWTRPGRREAERTSF
ncbi:MAG: phytoene/squalene synthase family protein [Holophagae bacterium]|jgi:phytoene synthase